MAYNSIDRIPRDNIDYWLVDHASEHINLLDNPFFTVNSRNIDGTTGITNSTSSNAFCFDRWKFTQGTVKRLERGCNYTSINTYQFKRFFQGIQAKPSVGDEFTVTLTGKVNEIVGEWYISSFGSASGQNYQTSNVVAIPTEVGEFVIEKTFKVPSAYVQSVPFGIGLYTNGVNNSIDIDIYAFKLERGNYSTLQMDYPPDYYLELIKCKTATVDATDTEANKTLADGADVDALEQTVATHSSQIETLQTDVEALETNKADADSVYTKSEADTLLNAKANSADVYTKTEVDTSQSAQNALITALQAENAQQADDIKFLKAVTEGKNWIAEVDSDEAYSKTIKSNVIPEANKASIDSYGGKSMVRNQLINNGNFADDSNWTRTSATLSVENNIATIIASGPGGITQRIEVQVGHRYYCRMNVKLETGKLMLRFQGEDGHTIFSSSEWVLYNQIYGIDTEPSTFTFYIRLTDRGYTAQVAKCGCIDLTQMFGSGNEPTTTDDPRIAMIESFLDANPSYYNPGEIVSAEVQNVVSRGKNLLDPTLLLDGTAWNIGEMSLKPNTTYIASTNNENTELLLYMTHSGGSPGSTTKVTSDHPVTITTNNDGIVKFQQRRASGTDSFANYEWQLEEGSTVTPYSPYRTDTLPIPSAVKALEGYGQSNGSDVNTVDFVNKVYHKKGYYDATDTWVADVEDIDIANLLTDFDNAIQIESGGTVTFEQQEGGLELPIPNTISYLRKVVTT